MNLPEHSPEQTAEATQRYAKFEAAALDWAEAQGVKSLESRVASHAALVARGQNLMALLLAACGGAAAWGGQVFASGAPPTAWGAAVTTGYLAGLGVYLARRVLRVRQAPATYSGPGTLLYTPAPLAQLKPGFLARLDERIHQQAALNGWLASGLNRAYQAAALAPLVFSAASAVAWRLGC